MEEIKDQIYLKRIKADDQKALELLFEKYYYSLCRFAKLFVKSTDLSEEIVSDVFFNIWQNREKLEINGNLKSYLFVAIKNQSLNVLNKNKFSFESIEAVDHQQSFSSYTAEYSISYLEIKKEIEVIIEELPPQRKIIFKLNKIEGFKYKEIAEILSISVSTVQKQMVEAVKYMSKYKSQFYAVSISGFMILSCFFS